MSIFERLKEDHDTVRELLQRAEPLIENFPDCDEEEADALVGDLIIELGAHNRAEEETLYETLQERDEDNLLPYESIEEHELAMTLLEELENNDFDIGERIAKLKILRKIILEHIEEEESDVFEYARECLSPEEQNEMAKEFDKKKKEILEGEQ